MVVVLPAVGRGRQLAEALGEANQLGLGPPEEWTGVENYSHRDRAGSGLHRAAQHPHHRGAGGRDPGGLLGSVAAWVFARAAGRTLGLLYFVFISGILISPAVVTTLLVLHRLRVAGGHLGMVLFYVGAALPFAVFLMTGFVKQYVTVLPPSTRSVRVLYLAEHEPAAVGVERAAGARGVLVGRRKGGQAVEAGHAERVDHRVRAAADHDVGVAAAEDLGRLADRLRATRRTR